MSNPTHFYVRLHKKDGRYSGHRLEFENFFREKHEENEEEPEKAEDSSAQSDHAEIKRIHAEFAQSMFGYIDVLPLIATLAPSMVHGIQQRHIANFLEENCSEKTEKEENEDFVVPIEKYGEFGNIVETSFTTELVAKQVPKMLTIGVVSSLEHLMALLFKEILKAKPYLIENSDKTISIRDVFSAGGTEEFKQQAIEQEIERIMRSRFDEQIDWLENQLDIKEKISNDYDRWDKLVEIVERRNLFAHANGIVNQRYIGKIKDLNFPGKSEIQFGKELTADPQYISSLFDVVSEFGTKLTQVVWRKLFSSTYEEADDELGNLGFELIQRGQYRLAARILAFANDLHGKKEKRRLLVDKINRANCYKLLEKEAECEELLSEEDWSSMSNEFLICSLAIRGDANGVAEKMSVMTHTKDWQAEHYESWPVFYHVREDRRVREEFQKIYGRELVPRSKKKSALQILGEIQDKDRAGDPL